MIIPSRFRIDPSTCVVLIHHVYHCDDADNDADRTVQEIATELDNCHSTISRSLLESALYCCNMENERGKFWHPLGWSFDKFVTKTIRDNDLHFDRYYNLIYEKKRQKKIAQGTGLDNNP